MLSKIVVSSFRSVGLELRRARPTHEDFPRLAHFLSGHGITDILDVGANRGQFAEDMFRVGYKGRIHSFEPIPTVHADLVKRAAAHGENWRVFPPVAVSNARGEAQFHVSQNTASSSLKNVTSLSTDAAKESSVASTIEVKTDTLDSLVESAGVLNGASFLKIDVQGHEREVLEGAKRVLAAVKGVKIELSLAPLYEQQAGAPELDDMLRGEGLECWDVVPGFRNRQSGRLLQYDAIYFRP